MQTAPVAVLVSSAGTQVVHTWLCVHTWTQCQLAYAQKDSTHHPQHLVFFGKWLWVAKCARWQLDRVQSSWYSTKNSAKRYCITREGGMQSQWGEKHLSANFFKSNENVFATSVYCVLHSFHPKLKLFRFRHFLYKPHIICKMRHVCLAVNHRQDHMYHCPAAKLMFFGNVPSSSLPSKCLLLLCQLCISCAI